MVLNEAVAKRTDGGNHGLHGWARIRSTWPLNGGLALHQTGTESEFLPRKISKNTKINPSEIPGWIARLFAFSAFFVAKSPMLGASDLRACPGLNSARRQGPARKAWSTAGPALREAAWAAGPPPLLAPWPSRAPPSRRTELKPRHALIPIRA